MHRFLVRLGMPALVGGMALVSHAQAPDAVLSALSVPDGFVVERAAGPDLAAYPMFMAFDEQGAMFVAESSGKDLSGKEMAAAPECMILRLVDTGRDGVYDSRSLFADTLSLPMGILWHQDSLYVASPPDFIRFRDIDGDGVAEEREVLLTGWNVLNTASLHGPFLGPDGWLYLTHGRHGYKIETKEGEVLEGTAARIWRCRPDGTGLERMAGGGFDNPVELIFTPGGETIGTMTYFMDPRNGQRDALMHWVEGGVYPKPHECTGEFIQTGPLMPTMTKFSRIAPAGLERYRSAAFGPDYEGMLFSAQFNPHRVQMHKLIQDGATYRTEDSNFLTSTYPDFFPTDVLEDADGSLLVSDTGAWYVDACPISRVSKPQIKGGIYRIRKADAPHIDDPWGASIDWEGMKPQELAALLADARPRVRDRAIITLERHGKQAVSALNAYHTSQAPEAARLEAFWCIARITGAKSSKTVLEGLRDPAPAIAMAAARMAGLEQDTKAVPGLIALLQHADHGVRRQAATALGQLNAKDAAGELLLASAGATDRFLEHALIYALIQIKEEAVLAEGLSNADPLVQKSAIIALDQLKSPVLTGEHVAELLDSESAPLRTAALWVAGHHPEWAPSIVNYLNAQLAAPAFEPADGLRDTVLAFDSQAPVQDLLGALLQPGAASPEARLWLLQTLQEAGINPLPDALQAAVDGVLTGGAPNERAAALQVVQRNGLTTFDDALRTLAARNDEDTLLRLQALAATAGRIESLTPAEIDLLQTALTGKTDPTNQLAAARVSASLPWSADQLRAFAGAYLPRIDTLTVGVVLPAFGRGAEEAVGLQLVNSLIALSKNAYINLEGALPAVLANYPASVHEAAKPLFDQWAGEREKRVARLQNLEGKLGQGDVGQGRRIFFGDKAACFTCHAIGSEGGRLGPDLTTIGLIRTGHDLLEAVLFPSASIVPGYETVRAETLEEEFIGVITRQDAEGLSIATGVDQTAYIAAKDLQGMKPHAISLMPEGLDAALTETELMDLITFLQSLNENSFLIPEVAKN
ncbi:MAG: HEAT repeat domain-containing protein [Candidatus Hydrogenedentes bacterium]|nr:HEAT repeat domain-containing protein [Candidatus Hydrogenedentota bacterium]